MARPLLFQIPPEQETERGDITIEFTFRTSISRKVRCS